MLLAEGAGFEPADDLSNSKAGEGLKTNLGHSWGSIQIFLVIWGY